MVVIKMPTQTRRTSYTKYLGHGIAKHLKITIMTLCRITNALRLCLQGKVFCEMYVLVFRVTDQKYNRATDQKHNSGHSHLEHEYNSLYSHFVSLKCRRTSPSCDQIENQHELLVKS